MLSLDAAPRNVCLSLRSGSSPDASLSLIYTPKQMSAARFFECILMFSRNWLFFIKPWADICNCRSKRRVFRPPACAVRVRLPLFGINRQQKAPAVKEFASVASPPAGTRCKILCSGGVCRRLHGTLNVFVLTWPSSRHFYLRVGCATAYWSWYPCSQPPGAVITAFIKNEPWLHLCEGNNSWHARKNKNKRRNGRNSPLCYSKLLSASRYFSGVSLWVSGVFRPRRQECRRCTWKHFRWEPGRRLLQTCKKKHCSMSSSMYLLERER